jgi:hypothetical protein
MTHFYDLTMPIPSSLPLSRSSGGRLQNVPEERVLRQQELDRLLAMGIHPPSLAGRLRLVLTIGCYGDFRFTRDILCTGAAREQTDLAIQTLEELGANCDCEVFQAVGQPPLGVLWHRHVPPVVR